MSQLEVNKINPATGTDLVIGDSSDTITITAGASLTGPVVASGLTGALPAISGASLTALSSSSLSGALPAIDGSALTNLPTETKPTISSISPSTITNAQASVTITGTNFVSVPTADAILTTGLIVSADEVAFTSSTEIIAKFTLTTDGSYYIRAENSDGNAVRSTTALLLVSDDPVWTTGSGSLGTFVKGAVISETVAATGDTVTYAVQSGTLPTGLSLATSTGIISGTESSSITSNTTYNFTIRATDAQAQYADRAFAMTINVSYDCYYLMVGGGGAGGSGDVDSGGYAGGGGGAGGYLSNYGGSAISLAGSTVYSITVGAGGLGKGFGVDMDSSGNGGNSTFFGLTVNGGGYGGTGAQAGSTGGSAGGSGGSTGGTISPTNADGTGNASGASSGGGSPFSGGGGGGSGGAGTTASSSTYGAGGVGTQNSISGAATYYAAGGGGSTWHDGYNGSTGYGQASGIGGRGDGRLGSTPQIAPTAYSGSGAGAGGSNNNMGGDGSGGSPGATGQVTLRMATSNYSGTTSGSPDVSTDGSDTILRFTANGSYTA